MLRLCLEISSCLCGLGKNSVVECKAMWPARMSVKTCVKLFGCTCTLSRSCQFTCLSTDDKKHFDLPRGSLICQCFTVDKKKMLTFQRWFLLENHNHQTNPHIRWQHIVWATTFRSGLPQAFEAGATQTETLLLKQYVLLVYVWICLMNCKRYSPLVERSNLWIKTRGWTGNKLSCFSVVSFQWRVILMSLREPSISSTYLCIFWAGVQKMCCRKAGRAECLKHWRYDSHRSLH